MFFKKKKSDSTVPSHTFRWIPRAGIALPGTRRSINFDGEQSTNAMWCHPDWWQLCGRRRHADRYGSVSRLTASASSPRFLLYRNNSGKAWGLMWDIPPPWVLLNLRVQIKAAFLWAKFITVVIFWVHFLHEQRVLQPCHFTLKDCTDH